MPFIRSCSSTHCTISLHFKTCTKCKDVVLQSVQKFRCSETFVWCLDYKLNLLGASCLTMHMRRHLHVPLGLCSNSGGNMEPKFVKIPKHTSKTLLLAFNVGNEERFVQKQRPETKWNPTKHFIFIPFDNKFGLTIPCYRSHFKICTTHTKFQIWNGYKNKMLEGEVYVFVLFGQGQFHGGDGVWIQTVSDLTGLKSGDS